MGKNSHGNFFLPCFSCSCVTEFEFNIPRSGPAVDDYHLSAANGRLPCFFGTCDRRAKQIKVLLHVQKCLNNSASGCAYLRLPRHDPSPVTLSEMRAHVLHQNCSNFPIWLHTVRSSQHIEVLYQLKGTRHYRTPHRINSQGSYVVGNATPADLRYSS